MADTKQLEVIVDRLVKTKAKLLLYLMTTPMMPECCAGAASGAGPCRHDLGSCGVELDHLQSQAICQKQPTNHKQRQHCLWTYDGIAAVGGGGSPGALGDG